MHSYIKCIKTHITHTNTHEHTHTHTHPHEHTHTHTHTHTHAHVNRCTILPDPVSTSSETYSHVSCLSLISAIFGWILIRSSSRLITYSPKQMFSFTKSPTLPLFRIREPRAKDLNRTSMISSTSSTFWEPLLWWRIKANSYIECHVVICLSNVAPVWVLRNRVTTHCSFRWECRVEQTLQANRSLFDIMHSSLVGVCKKDIWLRISYCFFCLSTMSILYLNRLPVLQAYPEIK